MAGVLWGVAYYAGIATSLYVIVDQTQKAVNSFSQTFGVWADTLSVTVSDVFSTVQSSSFFQLLVYVTSFDVPIEGLRSTLDNLLRVWMVYIVGGLLVTVETVVVVLGVLFLRSRLKKITMGLNGDGGLGGV